MLLFWPLYFFGRCRFARTLIGCGVFPRVMGFGTASGFQDMGSKNFSFCCRVRGSGSRVLGPHLVFMPVSGMECIPFAKCAKPLTL